MGISINSLQEGCCENLKKYNIIQLDVIKKDKTLASFDNIIKCNDKFIFIEEKSFLLDFIHKLTNFHGEINDSILKELHSKSKEEKQKIMYKVLFEKTISIDDKMKGTLIELLNDETKEKIKNSNLFYLYCEIEELKNFSRILTTCLNFKKGKKIISCKNINKIMCKEALKELK